MRQVSTRVIAVVAAWALLTTSGCGGGCPESRVPENRRSWEVALRSKLTLPVVPRGALAVKRDVHHVIIDVGAARLADAFHRVMRDPERRFGLIRVDRLPENAGRPFALGEKFQGRYVLEGAVGEELSRDWRQAFGQLADEPSVKEWLCRIENGHTSDYGMIVRLELDAAPGRPRVLQYVYLDGSPIAGSSTFWVRDIVESSELQRLGVTEASELEQVFEYQEQSETFATFFTAGGLKLHNQVVWSQAQQSAALAGGRILESDIPVEYREL